MRNKDNFLVREEKKILKSRKTYAQKYPLFFAFAGAFGLVCTFYGFEKLIDKIDLFTNNPWILLATGVTLLFITGTFYNKLR